MSRTKGVEGTGMPAMLSDELTVTMMLLTVVVLDGCRTEGVRGCGVRRDADRPSRGPCDLHAQAGAVTGGAVDLDRSAERVHAVDQPHEPRSGTHVGATQTSARNDEGAVRAAGARAD